MKIWMTVGVLTALMVTPAMAGDVSIEKVEVDARGAERFNFAVTLLHDDEGWDHYADLWQVLSPGGDVLGERVLAHPHENEQPFTRSAIIKVPEGISEVTIRARDTVHGWAEETAGVKIPGR